MITYEIEDLERIDISKIDCALLSGLGGSVNGYLSYLVRGYEDDIPTNSALQIIHSDQSCRAGVVLVHDEAAGRPVWMEAYSPADALDVYLGNKRTIGFSEGASLWRSSPGPGRGGGNASGSAGVVTPGRLPARSRMRVAATAGAPNLLREDRGGASAPHTPSV